MADGGARRWLGVDVGGANLKAATTNGFARSAPFELWKRPQDLAGALAQLFSECPRADAVAATMTGELADCYRTKAEGVASICDALAEVCRERKLRIYTTRGDLVPATAARSAWTEVAAANWHAIAAAAAARRPGTVGLAVDIGSTTTDVIPFSRGEVAAQGATDTQRLISGELIYLGVGRTPLCAVVDALPYRGGWCPVAAELFATTQDIAIMRRWPCAGSPTADSRPADRAHARERIARMIGADTETFTNVDAVLAAAYVAQVLEFRVAYAVRAVVRRMEPAPTDAVVSGAGDGLAEAACRRAAPRLRIERLADQLGRDASACAAAEAVAFLAEQDDGQ